MCTCERSWLVPPKFKTSHSVHTEVTFLTSKVDALYCLTASGSICSWSDRCSLSISPLYVAVMNSGIPLVVPLAELRRRHSMSTTTFKSFWSNLLLISSHTISKAAKYFCRYVSDGVDGWCEDAPSSVCQGRLCCLGRIAPQ